MPPIHADKSDGAITAASGGMPERDLQKVRKGFARHLSGPHRKFAMTDTAETANMAVDRNVVGRVGEDQIGRFTCEQALEQLAGLLKL